MVPGLFTPDTTVLVLLNGMLMLEGRVRDVIASVLSVAPGEVPARLSPETVPGWSSLRQVQLALALEQEFGLEVDPNVIPDLVSEAAIVEYVREVAA
jgi:acyl carrier protein